MRFAFALLLALAAGLAHGGAPLVILLSWDGMRWDYPERGDFPGLARLQRDGLRAERLTPGWPSNTFPGHVTLATGAWADVHGIVDNRFVDRVRGKYSYSGDADWLDAEPLWIAAERQGIRAATFFWVGSESDWRKKRATYRETPFDGSVPETTKVDRILAWIDLPAAERPGLVMSYWHGADNVGHEKGPAHPDVIVQIRQQDAQLVRLLDGLDSRDLWADTTLIVVSDHGMTPMTDAFDLAAFLDERGFRVQDGSDGPVHHLFIDDVAQRAQVLAALAGEPRVRAYPGDALPKAMRFDHPSRTGDVVVVAEPGVSLRPLAFTDRIALSVSAWLDDSTPGGHGFDPQHPDMGAIFIAAGRGIPRGVRRPAIRQIDVAPTVARLLDIDPPAQSIGRSIFE